MTRKQKWNAVREEECIYCITHNTDKNKMMKTVFLKRLPSNQQYFWRNKYAAHHALKPLLDLRKQTQVFCWNIIYFLLLQILLDKLIPRAFVQLSWVSQKEWWGFERKYLENSKDIQEIKITILKSKSHSF